MRETRSGVEPTTVPTALRNAVTATSTCTCSAATQPQSTAEAMLATAPAEAAASQLSTVHVARRSRALMKPRCPAGIRQGQRPSLFSIVRSPTLDLPFTAFVPPVRLTKPTTSILLIAWGNGERQESRREQPTLGLQAPTPLQAVVIETASSVAANKQMTGGR